MFHKKISDFAKLLGLENDGMCRGLALMNISATQIGDSETFDERMGWFLGVPEDEFQSKLDDAKKLRFEYWWLSKLAVMYLETGDKKKFEGIDYDQVFTDNEMDQIISKVTEYENSLKKSDRENFRKKATEQFDKKIGLFPGIEQTLKLDPLGFFNNVFLYQDPEKYPHILNATLEQADTVAISKIAKSKKLEEIVNVNKSDKNLDNSEPLPGLAQINPRTAKSGLYIEEDFSNYFSSLKIAIKKQNPPFTKPITLLISRNDHAYSVTYYPKMQKWKFFDANCIEESFAYRTEKELAKQIIAADSDITKEIVGNQTAINSENLGEMYTTFSTKFYCLPQDSTQIEEIVRRWDEDPVNKMLHTVTAKKAAFDDPKGSWLITATRFENIEQIKELIAKGANINFARHNGNTVLHTATLRGNSQIVELLLQQGVDPKKRNGKGYDPLYVAVATRDFKLVNLFIEKTNITPLLNVTEKISSARAFATANHCEKEMEEFINSKISDPKATHMQISHYELAQIMGQKEIAEKIKNKVITEEIVKLDQKNSSPELQQTLAQITAKRSEAIKDNRVFDNLQTAFATLKILEKHKQWYNKFSTENKSLHPNVQDALKKLNNEIDIAFEIIGLGKLTDFSVVLKSLQLQAQIIYENVKNIPETGGLMRFFNTKNSFATAILKEFNLDAVEKLPTASPSPR